MEPMGFDIKKKPDPGGFISRRGRTGAREPRERHDPSTIPAACARRSGGARAFPDQSASADWSGNATVRDFA